MPKVKYPKDKELERKFKLWENNHHGKLDPLQKDLRDKVLLAHELIEINLDILLTRSSYSGILGPLRGERKAVLESQIVNLLNTSDFMRKLTFAQDQNLLPRGAKEKIRFVNDIRNWFSHSKAYSFQLETYQRYEHYLEAVKKIVEAKELMDKILSDFIPGESAVSNEEIVRWRKAQGIYIDLENDKKTKEIVIRRKGSILEVSEVNYQLNEK